MAARNTARFALIAGLACSLALAPGVVAYAATSSDDDAETIEWSIDMDCTASCHTRQVETLTDEDTQIYASHASFACTVCHTDVEGMEKGHDGVTTEDTEGPKRLKKSEVSSDACLTCHEVTDGTVSEGAWAASEEGGAEESEMANETDGEETATNGTDTLQGTAADDSSESVIPAYSASATADITYLTDANGTTVNPHDLPVNKSHDTITCATCHTMHDDEPLAETAADACTKCHHDNVYECYTCHD